VDKIIAITETNVITEKRVKSDEPFFKGHFPENPIMPGVLVCEAVFQSGVILISGILKNAGKPVLESKGLPVLTRIKEVKFKNMVRPDDLLQIEVELVEEIGGAYFMKGMAKVAGKVVLRTEFAAIISTR